MCEGKREDKQRRGEKRIKREEALKEDECFINAEGNIDLLLVIAKLEALGLREIVLLLT